MQKNKSITNNDWAGISGIPEQTPQGIPTEQQHEQTVAISKKPCVGEPVTRPVIISYDAARLLIKQSAIKHKREIEKYLEAGGISVVFDDQNNMFNSFNTYTERVVLGLLFELDRQGQGLAKYIQYVKECKHENKPAEQRNKRIEAENRSIERWNKTHPNETKPLHPFEPLPHTMPISTTQGSNGAHVTGYDIDRFTPEEWGKIAEMCNIKRGEPFVVVDIPKFAQDWFGITPKGRQYEVFRNIISGLGKTDFVYIDSEEKTALRTQLFTTYDGVLLYGEKKRYTIVKVAPTFLRNIGARYIKAPENLLNIVQKTRDNMGIRLFLEFMEELSKNKQRGRKPIVKHYNVRGLILKTAEENDIQQRRWKKLEIALYEQLEMLKQENVLLDYTQREFNTTGIVTVHINPQPFTRKIGA